MAYQAVRVSLIFICLPIQYSFAMQQSNINLVGAAPMSADAAILLQNMAASSSSSSAAPIVKMNQLDKQKQEKQNLAIARAVMLECKDSQGSAGLPPELFNMVMAYALHGYVVKSVQTPTADLEKKTMSPDGSIIVGVGKEDNEIELYNQPDKLEDREFVSYDLRSVRTNNLESVSTILAASNDGHLLAARPAGIHVFLWPVKDSLGLGFPHEPIVPDQEITALAVDYPKNSKSFFAFGDNSLVLRSMRFNGSIAFIRHRFLGHSVPATALAIDANNNRIASATDTEIKMWNVQDQSCLRTIPHDMGTVRSLSFSPKGYALVGASDNKIRVYKSANGNLRAAFEPQACLNQADKSKANPINAASMSDERTVLSLTEDGVVKTWKLVTTCDEALALVQKKEHEAVNKKPWCAIQ